MFVKDFGENLQKLRELYGMTQAEVAEALGVQQSSVSSWENNEAVPNIMNLYNLAKLFDTNMEDFLDESAIQANLESYRRVMEIRAERSNGFERRKYDPLVVGARIKEICRDNQIPLEVLYSESGLNKSTITKLRSGGLTNPTYKTFVKICNALKISLRDFFDSELFE